MRQLAYEEAARLFRQALDVGGPELDDEQRCVLLLAGGTAAHLSTDLTGRLDACLEVAELARGLGRPDLSADAALVMEAVGVPRFDVATRRLCEEAIAALGDEPTSQRARVTARLAESLAYLREMDRALPANEAALTMAETTGDPFAVAAALHARQLVQSGPDGLDERAQLAERMLGLSRETHRLDVEMWARLWRIDVWFERGELGRVATEVDALARCIRPIEGPRERFQVLRCKAALAQAQARFTDAHRLASEAFAVMAPTGQPAPHVVRAAIHQPRWPPHRPRRGLPSREQGTRVIRGNTGELRSDRSASAAHALVAAGRQEEAAEIYRALGPVSSWEPLPHIALFSYAFGIAAATALGITAHVAALHDLLAPYRGHHVVSGAGAVAYFGPVELWLGIAAHHLGRLDAAADDLERAAACCERNGAAGFHVEANLELAAVLDRRNRPMDADRATALVGAAASEASSLGMRPFAEKAASLRARMIADSSGPRLTHRELEVAELIGQGLTNREIAGRLVLSERTAQNHVQHILTKLGLRNRSEVAVWIASRR